MYQGKQGLVWFTGVVEDRNDPKALNRVRVRIYGAHTDDKSLIATPDLPWSEVLMPTTSPALSGLGTTTHGLVEGSTVMGFWRDGKDQQDAVVMGSLIGSPLDFYKIDETIDDEGTRTFNQVKRSPSKGFNDPRLATEEDYDKDNNPDGKNAQHITRTYGLTLALDKSPRRSYQSKGQSYPKAEYFALGQEEDLDSDGIWSTDVNFLARGDTTQYPVIDLAKGEPNRDNYVKPIYPFNHVHETESGHVIEIDDTPDHERLHAYHRTGTRVEIDKDGTYVEKIVKDKYTLILDSDTVKIQGTVDVVVGKSLTANAIATAGGSVAVADAGTTDLVDEDGNLTEAAKKILTDAGVTEEEVTKSEEPDTAPEKSEMLLDNLDESGATEVVHGKTMGDKIVDATREATESFTKSYDELKNDETFKQFQTIVGVVEGVKGGAAGAESVISQLEEHTGKEFNSDVKDVLTSVLSGADAKDVVMAKGIEIAKDKLTEVIKETAVVKAMEQKLESIMGEAITSVDGLKAVVGEKVGEAVTTVLGEEAGAKAAEAISGEVIGGVAGATMGAVMSLAADAQVNIRVVGGTKLKSGSVNIISEMGTNVTTLAGGTNITTGIGNTTITSGMNTTITSLTGALSLSALAGVVNVAAPAGMINLASPAVNIASAAITSSGVWTHAGALTAGAVTAASVIAPIITSGTSTLATHTHPIASGSSAGSTLPGVG